ncbi:MAG: hypothetical protein H0V70_11915 [Ktedonobacteraceae bacterium]|nr:hypothetical protein [Ktedonobacteraceae bacterium]
MENSYPYNSFIFIGNTSHAREYSANSYFSSLLVAGYSTHGRLNTLLQRVRSDEISALYNNDEYMESTSPYDDDGY